MPRFREYHLHLPHFSFDNGREMKLLFAVRVIRDLIVKVSMFFLPVFLFQLGFSQLGELSTPWFYLGSFQLGMLMVGAYFLILRTTVLVLSLPVAKLMQKIGTGRMLALSHIWYVLVFALLMLGTNYWWLVLVAAFIDGVQIMFFWTPYHVMLADNAHSQYMGRDLGLLQFLLQLTAVLAPAVAGASILLFGYSFVFLFAVGASLLCMIFAFQLKNNLYQSKVSFSELGKWLRIKNFRRLALSYTGRYVNDAVIAVWPLYVFLVLGAVDKVGYLYTVSLFLAMMFSLFIGAYIDKNRGKGWFFASGGFLSLLWVARSFVTSLWTIAVVDMAERLSSNFHWLFFDSQFLKGGKGKKIIPYFVYRELILSAGGVVFWLAFSIIFAFAQSWTVLFILAAVGVMMSLAVTDSLNKVQ